MGVRAVGVSAAVLLLGFGWSQSGDLVVTPRSGGPGTTVTVSQDVEPVCGTFTVLFDLLVMGEDDASDGHGEVTFQVPEDVSGRDHTIEARCRRGGGGGGSASFQLEAPATTTTTHEVPTTDDPGETTTTRNGVIPTTTTTEGDAPIPQNGEECEEQARQADAHLAYEPERSMVVGKRYEVTAAVSLDEVPTHVTFEGTTTVVTIGGVRCTITAQLSGSDFAISQRSNEEQSFLGTRELVWSWTVRPLHDGDDLELALTFQSKIFDAGHSILGPTALHEAHIDVDAVSQSGWSRAWDGFSGFLHDPIIASVIAAIVGAALLTLGPRTYRNVRARYPRRPSTGPEAGASVPPPPPE